MMLQDLIANLTRLQDHPRLHPTSRVVLRCEDTPTVTQLDKIAETPGDIAQEMQRVIEVADGSDVIEMSGQTLQAWSTRLSLLARDLDRLNTSAGTDSPLASISPDSGNVLVLSTGDSAQALAR